jgi:hypothetical protein
MPLNEQQHILILGPLELEELIKKWIARLEKDYHGFDRPSRSADMGRDAVGFLSSKRYDGEWHNYQCKQLSKPLGIASFVLELGKIFHYACAGHFTLPTKYIFVAPKSGIGDVNEIVGKPSAIGPYLIKHWDEYCLTRISSPKNPTPLTNDIRSAIENYEFANVELWNVTHLVEKKHMRAVLMEHIDIDPGPAPTVSDDEVPATAHEHEAGYIEQLITVFGENRGHAFADLTEVAADPEYAPQMNIARRRYLEHRAFGAHFRESLFESHIKQVDQDIHDAIYEQYLSLRRGPRYDRMMTLMTSVVPVVVSGPLGKHNRVTVSVRQGACHHFANIRKLPWT